VADFLVNSGERHLRLVQTEHTGHCNQHRPPRRCGKTSPLAAHIHLLKRSVSVSSAEVVLAADP
jgi:hypothetical protein